MRRIAIWLIVILAMLTSITSMDKCLKNGAFARTAVITTVACDTVRCSCGDCCQYATATYIGALDGHDGMWLTSSHAVEGANKTIWVDGHVADLIDGACVLTKGTCIESGDVGWAALKTVGYVPCGACPAQPDFGVICCGRQLFFVDIQKCRTVTKCHMVSCCADSTLFKTDTLPDCPNCGAVAYDMCGRMVGLLVGGGKECCPDQCGRCGVQRYTAFLPVTPDMFRCLEPEQPADAVAPQQR
jgi:hypothetical protein